MDSGSAMITPVKVPEIAIWNVSTSDLNDEPKRSKLGGQERLKKSPSAGRPRANSSIDQPDPSTAHTRTAMPIA